MDHTNSTEFEILPSQPLSLAAAKPNYMLSFHRHDKELGRFDFNGECMTFSGAVDASGKVFVDWVLDAFQSRIDEAVAAEREACAKVCDGMEFDYWHSAEDQNNFTPVDCANAIRARGQA